MAWALLAVLFFPVAREGEQLNKLLQSGDFEVAAELLEKELALPGKRLERAEAALLLAQCYLEMRLPQKVAKALALCPQEFHQDPRYVYCKAESLVAKGDSLAAEKLLRSIKAAAAGLEVKFRLGVLLYEKGDYRGAEELLKGPAGGAMPDYYCCIYRARALLALDRPAEGRRVLGPVQGEGGTPEVKYLSGRCAYALKEFETAAGHFRSALQADAGYIEAAFLLSESLRRSGDRNGARAAQAEFLKLQKTEQGRAKQANLLSQRCRREPGNISAWVEAGIFHLASKDTDQATSHAWQALQLDPASVAARLLLARSLRDTGRYAQAALHYRKILVREQGNGPANTELREMIRKHADK